MSNQNSYAYKSQMTRFYMFAFAFLAVFLGIGYYITQEDSPTTYQQMPSDLPLDHLSPQEMWMSRVETEGKIFDQRMKYLEDIVLETKKKEIETEQENDLLRRELSKLKNELKDLSDRPVQEAIYANTPPFPTQPYSERSDPFLSLGTPTESQPMVMVRGPLIEVVVDGTPETIQHVDKVIPAGTSVKAVLLSSVDIPCGVFGSTDPQPVKLRILDNGHLPKGVEARIKGGIIIGSVYGDLSNERAYMRIERLTQVRPDGRFVETDVTGYVSGEDGKYGVRGTVIDKSIKMVGNAALSGFFSGVSEYLQATVLAKSCGGYGPACAPGVVGPAPGFYANSVQLAEQAGTQGATNAFDMLTDYYIKRAEQIRPVIEVTAGRIVDITFTHSAELGDLYTKEKVRAIREHARGQS